MKILVIWDNFLSKSEQHDWVDYFVKKISNTTRTYSNVNPTMFFCHLVNS